MKKKILTMLASLFFLSSAPVSAFAESPFFTVKGDNGKAKTYGVTKGKAGRSYIHDYKTGKTSTVDGNKIRSNGKTIGIEKTKTGWKSFDYQSGETKIYTKGPGNSVTEFDTSNGKVKTFWLVK
jgi:hypothetical protein